MKHEPYAVPAREAHQCLCVLVHVIDGQAQGVSPCWADAEPDAPYCSHCEGRHPGWQVDEGDGVLVRHRQLGGVL